MRINVDRLCELAGIPGARSTRGSGLIRESRSGDGGAGGEDKDEGMDMPHEARNMEESEAEIDKKMGFDEAAKGEDDDSDKNKDEVMLEIDEKDLVNELRRARVIMRERRRIAAKKQQQLQEMQLKGIIDQEVKNVLKELQLNSGWMYGNRKPTRSRAGFTHQGSFLKGLGFK